MSDIEQHEVERGNWLVAGGLAVEIISINASSVAVDVSFLPLW